MAHLKLKITANSHAHEVVIDKVSGEYKVTIDGQIYKCIFKENVLYINGEALPIDIDGDLSSGASVKTPSRQMQVRVEQVREVEILEVVEDTKAVKGAAAGAILAPMPGKVINVKVKVGDLVKTNQVVIILEAMKMENEIMAEVGGKVKEVRVKPGEAVEGGQPLVVLE